MSTLQILSQESGWVDSAGYKQQRYKTGEIKQLLYTSTGDTIITVTKDSVWHRYLWDTKSGRLLNEKKILTKNYLKVYGIWFTAYAKTYTIAAQDQDKHTYVLIYRSLNDSLVGKVKISLENMYNCFAYHYESSKTLWVGRSTKYFSVGLDVHKISGNIVKYIHDDSIFSPVFNVSGSPHSFSASYDGQIAAWNSIMTELKTYKATTLIDRVEQFHYRMKNDNIESFKIPTTRRAADFGTFPIEIILQYSSNLSPMGNHGFNNFLGIFQHTYIPISQKVKDSNINKSLYQQSSSNEEFLILPIGSRLFVYDISQRKFIDSIFLRERIIHTSISLKNNMSVYLDNNQLVNVSLSKNIDSLRSVIYTSHHIRYQDSAIIFNSIRDSTIMEYIWDFGDDKKSIGQYVTTTYNKPGKYKVSLSLVRRKQQLIDTLKATIVITILPLLQVDFDSEKNYGLTPLTIKFNDRSQGMIKKRKWDFGDGSIDTNSHPLHIFKGNKYYNITLTVHDTLSQKSITKTGYITTSDFPLISLKKLDYIVNNAQSYSFGQYQQTEYNNTYRSGIILRDSLYAYFQECVYENYDEGGSRNTSFKLGMDIRNPQMSLYKNVYHTVEFGPYSCKYPSKVKLIPYRKLDMVTSTIIQTKHTMYPKTYESLYFTKKGEFAPSGWSHDFNGVFLPDGTDIFLFRNKQSNLQFFYNDTTAFHRLDFSAQFSDIFAMPDSLSCLLFTNPAFDLSDSTNSFTLNTLDNKGILLREVKIPKTINAAITCLRPLDHDSFFIAGYTGTRNDKGQIIDKKGYIAIININGFIEWQNTIPTYSDIRTIQKHPNNYFAALGLPHANQKHGFIAFRENGKILADFRLFDAHSSFYPNDFIIGNKEHDIWFIGEEYIENQGKRATVYSCNNPVTPTTDIDESLPLIFSNNDMTVFPNPARDLITLTNVTGKYSIFDSMGNVLLQSHSDRLDISHLPNGIYFIKSHTISSKTMSFIIQR